MNRLNFIKRLGTLLAVSAMPVSASALNKEEKYFKFDDIFYRPYPNKNLLYLKPGCEIDAYLRNRLEGKVTEKDEFSCVYLGLNDLILPFTEKYTLTDFDYVVRSIKSRRYEMLCKPMIRFFHDKDGLHPTIFLWYEQQFSIKTKS